MKEKMLPLELYYSDRMCRGKNGEGNIKEKINI